MSLRNLISNTIPALSPDETAETGLSMMDDYKIQHLPVVSNTMDYCGIVSETELYDMPDSFAKVGSLPLSKPSATIEHTILSVIDQMAGGEYSMLPVVDSNNKYQGYITQQSVINELAKLTSASMPGGIIEIETEAHNYSPALIASISENNSMKITSLLSQPHGTKDIRATIKLNGPETSSVIQGLERYGYRIRNVHYGDTKYSDMLEERYNALMRYMEV